MVLDGFQTITNNVVPSSTGETLPWRKDVYLKNPRDLQSYDEVMYEAETIYDLENWQFPDIFFCDKKNGKTRK